MNLKKLSIGLLVGTSIAHGALVEGGEPATPITAARNWIQAKKDGRNPQQPYMIQEALKTAADQAKKDGNPERVLELWRTQKMFNTETNELYWEFHAYQAHEALKEAADQAKEDGNPERVLELWRTQKMFNTESGSVARGLSEEIKPWKIHEALKKAEDQAKEDGNPERVLELWRTQKMFNTESGHVPKGRSEEIDADVVHSTFSTALQQATDHRKIVSMYEAWVEFEANNRITSWGQKKPDAFKAKYESAKAEVARMRALVPANVSLEAPAAGTTDLTVGTVRDTLGRFSIKTGSFAEFMESFDRFYKQHAPRNQPGQPGADAEMYRFLTEARAFVDSLTNAQFTASPK